MKVARIPLGKRLERIRKGNAGDEEYNILAIRRFANIPVVEYLRAFPDEYERLLDILGRKKQDSENMTYQDVAEQINVYYDAKENINWIEEAMDILAAPFRNCYEYVSAKTRKG